MSAKAGCSGMRKPATKKSSYTMASPSVKYHFSTISLILPMVMVDDPK
jgi:hypothetical protein